MGCELLAAAAIAWDKKVVWRDGPRDNRSRGTADPKRCETCRDGERLSDDEYCLVCGDRPSDEQYFSVLLKEDTAVAEEDTAVAEGGSKIQAVASADSAVNPVHNVDEFDPDYGSASESGVSPISTVGSGDDEATIHPPATEVPVSAKRRKVERSFGRGSGSITTISLSSETIAREFPKVSASLRARERSRSSRANAGSRRARSRSESATKVRERDPGRRERGCYLNPNPGWVRVTPKSRPAPKAHGSNSEELRSRGTARRLDAAEKSQERCNDKNLHEEPTRNYFNTGSGLEARDATNSWSSALEVTSSRVEEAQPRVFKSVAPPLCNFMVSHIVSSRECCTDDLSRKLRESGCNCIFVTLTDACYNQGRGHICRFLLRAVCENEEYTAVADLLKEKTVYRVGKRAFAVVHKAKTEGCAITRGFIHGDKQWPYNGCPIDYRSRNEPDIELTTLELLLDVERQQRREMRIAYVNISAAVADYIVHDLEQYIVVNQLSMITGSFKGESFALGAALGRAGAVASIPSYQALLFQGRLQERTHPSYFVFFGPYKDMTWPEEPSRPPEEIVLGEDIEDEMLPVSELPHWAHNKLGSSHLPHLGKIKMKQTDFAKWCRGTFETTLWIGQAAPSKKSQSKNAWRHTQSGNQYRQSKGKGKHK